MDFEKTGKIIADALGKALFWVDIIAILTKEEVDGFVNRKLVITDCRFETVDMANRNYELEGEDITFENIIGLFSDML